MASNSSNGASTIGRGTVIRGTVRGEGDIEIDGRVEGVVDVDGDVTLGESARIRIEDGALSGRRVTVRGAVAGNIRGVSSLLLEEGARVVGDLASPSIGIRPGGMLRGHVSTGDIPADAAQASRARSSRAVTTPQPAARRAPPPARVAPPPPPPVEKHRAPVVTQRTASVQAPAPAEATVKAPVRDAAPPPIMPALRKGQRGQMKRKNGK